MIEVGNDRLRPCRSRMVKDGAGWRFDVDAGPQRDPGCAISATTELSGRCRPCSPLSTRSATTRPCDPMKTGVAVLRPPAPELRPGAGGTGSARDRDPGEPASRSAPAGSPGPRPTAESRARRPLRLPLPPALRAKGRLRRAAPASYLVNGRMIGGFGAVAWPVRYGETGVTTFIVEPGRARSTSRTSARRRRRRAAARSVSSIPDKGWTEGGHDAALSEAMQRENSMIS